MILDHDSDFFLEDRGVTQCEMTLYINIERRSEFLILHASYNRVAQNCT